MLYGFIPRKYNKLFYLPRNGRYNAVPPGVQGQKSRGRICNRCGHGTVPGDCPLILKVTFIDRHFVYRDVLVDVA